MFQVGQFPDLEEIIRRHAHDSECDEHVAYSIRQIVSKSSIQQTLKGLASAGFGKSTKYSMAEVFKMAKSKNR